MPLTPRAITIVPCAIIIFLFDINKIMNLLNVVQFVQLPFSVIPLLKCYNSPNIMVNFRISKFKLWMIIVLSVLIQIFNIFSVNEVVKDSKTFWKVLVWVLVAIYLLFLGKNIF